MELAGITDEKLQHLVKAAMNAGGTLAEDVQEALKANECEKEFEYSWYWKLRQNHSRVAGFYNEIAERLGKEQTRLFA